MKKIRQFLIVITLLVGLLFSTAHTGAQSREERNPYAPLEWLIGKWLGGERQGVRVSMTFEWGTNKTYIKYSGTRPLNGKVVPEYEGMIVWHGVKKKIVLMSVYLAGEKRYVMEEGEIEILPGIGVRRHFTVFYAEGEKLPWSDRKIAPIGGAALEFQQTWKPEGPDGLRGIFLMKKDGEWQSPHAQPEGFLWRRAPAVAQ